MSFLVKSVKAMGWMVEKLNIIKSQAEYIAVCEQALLDAAKLRSEQELWTREIILMLPEGERGELWDGSWKHRRFISALRKERVTE